MASATGDSLRVVKEVLAASLGSCVADTTFNALEVVKVKLQVQEQSGKAGHYRSMVHAVRRIAREEGVIGGLFLPGLGATTLRAFTYTGCRIGLYPSVRRLVSTAWSGGDGCSSPPLGAKVFAGACTGALASSLFSPVDVVRIRMQADAGRTSADGRVFLTGLRAGQEVRYPTTVGAFGRIARAEGGLPALWRGWQLTVARAAILSGTQLSAYDSLKQSVKGRGYMDEGAALHTVCSFASGLLAQAAVQPIDTLRSRAMAVVAGEARGRMFAGGLAGLYSGFLPAACRQAPVICVQMPIVEWLRVHVAGLEPI